MGNPCAKLGFLLMWTAFATPTLADGPYCPTDREPDCPNTGLVDGCCWDMHFDFESGSDPNLALGEQANLNERLAVFGVRFGTFLLPDLSTGRFGRASGESPRVAHGIPVGQLLAQEQCNSFAISFEPGLRVHRVQFTLKGMAGGSPVYVRTDAQYRDEYSRTYWQRIENPGAPPLPPIQDINEVRTISLADAAAQASRGNVLLGFRITFDDGVCESAGLGQLPPPIKIDDLYVWALNPPDVARNSVRALAVEASQGVMTRPTEIENPSVPVQPDTRLMIDEDRRLPFVAGKATFVRFYLGARYRKRAFKPRFEVGIEHRDGTITETAVEWQEALPAPPVFDDHVRNLTEVPHIPLTASEETIFQELFKLRHRCNWYGTQPQFERHIIFPPCHRGHQTTGDLFVPGRFTRDAKRAVIKIFDADEPGGVALGAVKVLYEDPVTLGLNVVQVVQNEADTENFEETYEDWRDRILWQVQSRQALPISQPIEVNFLPGMLDTRPLPNTCEEYLSDRASLFIGIPPIEGTNWTSNIVVQPALEDSWLCFGGAIQGPNAPPLIASWDFWTAGDWPSRQIAFNIGLPPLCRDWDSYEDTCEMSWPYANRGFGEPYEANPLQRYGNRLSYVEQISGFGREITVNPVYWVDESFCPTTASSDYQSPYCHGGYFDDLSDFTQDLMAPNNFPSDITYYRLYQCLAKGRCFDPQVNSLPDYETRRMVEDMSEASGKYESSAKRQRLIFEALTRLSVLNALDRESTRDTHKTISTTFSISDFSSYPDITPELQDTEATNRMQVLVVSGAIAPDGKIRDVKIRSASLSQKQISLPSEGTFGLEMHTADGLYGVIGFEPYAVAGNRKPSLGFNLVAPYTDKLTKLVIRRGNDVILIKKDHSPKLDVVLDAPAVKGNAIWGKKTEIMRWKVIGILSGAAEQVVEFSPDMGMNWYPIAALPSDRREITINPKNVPASKRARVAVSVSDGIAARRVESEAFVVER